MARSRPFFDTVCPAGPEGAHSGHPRETIRPVLDTRPRQRPRVPKLSFCLGLELPALCSRDIAELVEAALALHIVSNRRRPLTFLEDRKVFADWIWHMLIFG